MLPRTAVHWLSSVKVGAKFGVEQFAFYIEFKDANNLDVFRIWLGLWRMLEAPDWNLFS